MLPRIWCQWVGRIDRTGRLYLSGEVKNPSARSHALQYYSGRMIASKLDYYGELN